MPDGPTHIFRASLKPKVYREIEIDSRRSLRDLAEAITRAFGFDFDHAFGFYSKLTGRYHESPEQYELFADMADTPSDAKSVKRTTVARAFAKVGKKMLFIFDYGDGWRFQVELVGLGQKTPKTGHPKILSTVGKAPQQYPSDEDE